MDQSVATGENLGEQIQTNSSPAPRADVDDRRTAAWIGQGVVIEGRITSSQDLRIDGRVEGTIEVGNHALIIGARAEVKANLSSKSILISGTVIGNVIAAERVDLQATGSVEGDITAPRLMMVDGAVVRGKVKTTRRESTVNVAKSVGPSEP